MATDCLLCDRAAAWPLCDICHDRAAADIGALPADVAELDNLTPTRGAPLTRVTGSHCPSLPMDLAADETRRAIVWTCGVWEPPVREAARLTPAPERVPPALLVARAARVFSANLSRFAALGPTWGYPDGPEAPCVQRDGLYGVSSLRALHRRAAWLVGIVRPAMHVPGWCRRCGAAALLQDVGSAEVTCGHCGRRITADRHHTDLSMVI